VNTTFVNPSNDQRKLKLVLRHKRDETGLLQREVAEAMDWSPSKVVRIENGTVRISTNDLKALLNLYRVGPAEVEEIIALAKASRRPPWWSEFADLVSPEFGQQLGFESSASRLFNFYSTVVPGLLQTPEYAQAIISNFVKDDIARLVNLRMRRQEIFVRPEPPQAHFIMGEAALHIQVGGPQILRAQLERLLDLMKQSQITIEIIPFTAGAHSGMIGPFEVLGFDDGDGDVAVFESPTGLTLIREEVGIVSKYRQTFEALSGISAKGDDAVARINKLIKGLTD